MKRLYYPFTRRQMLLALGLFPALSINAKTSQTNLRILKIRHSGFLIQKNGIRIAIDPWFSRLPGEGIWANATQPSIEKNQIGPIDLLCFTGSTPPHFDFKTLKTWQHKSKVLCLVPTLELQKKLRHLGFQNIRVVAPNDDIHHRSLQITISPAGSYLAQPEIGFLFTFSPLMSKEKNSPIFGAIDAKNIPPHLLKHKNTNSIWHMGTPLPLSKNKALADFAKKHSADVVLAYFGAFQTSGQSWEITTEDALLLAKVAHAQWAIPQGDAVTPTPPFKFFLQPTKATSNNLQILHIEHRGWTQFP